MTIKKQNKEIVVISYDERRDIVTPGDLQASTLFSIQHFFTAAQEAIADHGYFAVALSGGNTPKAIYQQLADPINAKKIDWNLVKLFWSDERPVPPFHPDSNYKMAMEAGFGRLSIPSGQIYRMQAEGDIEQGALAYETLIKRTLKDARLDLVLLGVGNDGHTASLFPQTHGLHSDNRLVIANYIPQLNSWRMTLTFDCINAAQHIVLYVFGKSKTAIVKKVFNGEYQPDLFPVQRVGTSAHKALWVLDNEAALGWMQRTAQ
jgi:6-phosphogluconolactonase